ncbi:MAG: hypothetical protein JXB50_03625 [Spirochaetes bacterium]|nr:hypothetical protein [Spirochaetota bacterium]
MKINFIIIYLFLIFFFNCSKITNFSVKTLNEKYREITPVDLLYINSNKGDIEIIGWAKDTIEIRTKKYLYTGLANDINLMSIKFLKEGKKISVDSVIPARVDGKIDIKFYIPFILLKIFIDSNIGNINISNYLGNLDITNNNGSIQIDFQGNFLRINSNDSKIDLNIKSYSSSDMIINNEDGNIKINVSEIGNKSYLDIKSINGNILLNLQNKINHDLVVLNENKNIDINYKLRNYNFIEGTTNYLYGTKNILNNNLNNLKIYIKNINGKIIVNEVN